MRRRIALIGSVFFAIVPATASSQSLEAGITVGNGQRGRGALIRGEARLVTGIHVGVLRKPRVRPARLHSIDSRPPIRGGMTDGLAFGHLLPCRRIRHNRSRPPRDARWHPIPSPRRRALALRDVRGAGLSILITTVHSMGVNEFCSRSIATPNTRRFKGTQAKSGGGTWRHARSASTAPSSRTRSAGPTAAIRQVTIMSAVDEATITGSQTSTP